MRKVFRKLFNLDRVEALRAETERLKELWVAAEERRNRELEVMAKKVEALKVAMPVKTWKGLSQFDDGKTYFVVTQGGYYPIKGWKIKNRVMQETTRRAVKNGFVVASESEAERLQQALKALAW